MKTQSSPDAPLRAYIRPALVCAVAIAFVAATTWAKRVVCIDGCNTAFVNNHEGYERSLTNGTTDIVSVGGDLTACLSNVMSGDTLVIVAHGSGGGTGFTWGGAVYTNFGSGAGLMPLPSGFGSLTNVSLSFCSCWAASTNVPSSLVQKLLSQMGGGGGGNTGGGFQDYSIASLCYTVSGGTSSNRQAAINCLKMNPGWMANPPVNRQPPASPNQQTAAQTAVDNCPGAGGASNLNVMITAYKVPYNSTNAAPGAGNASAGCGCAGSEPYCGIAEGIVVPPALAITRTADPTPGVVLAWPGEFTDFFPESATNLTGATFNPYSGLIVTDDQSRYATNDHSSEQAFFRLRSTPACLLTITQQPQSTMAPVGQRATFSVQASGTPGPTLYQWFRTVGPSGFMPIPGADGPFYMTPPVSPQDNNSQFACVIANGCTNVQSQPALLIVPN